MQGRVVANRYRLDDLIGEGAMGAVWRAQHLALSIPVAVKLINVETARNPDALARFEREAKVAARIKSAHVVTMMDHGSDQGQPFIVMEWLQGESLAQRLARVGRLSLAETARLVSHVCRALAHAHDLGLVHRDIKPGNVVVTPAEDGGEIYKVLDFGLAKATDQLAFGVVQTKTGAMLGTPFYMSPEQAQGLKTLDHRSDLWSVGVMSFECLTGKRPFQAKGLGPLIAAILGGEAPVPSSVAPDLAIPGAVDQWMKKALCRDPEGRFASAREQAEAFRLATAIDDSQSLDSSWSRPRPTDAAAHPIEPSSGSGTWVDAASFHDPSSAAGEARGERPMQVEQAVSVDDGAATLMLPSAAEAAASDRSLGTPAPASASDLQATVALAGGGTLFLEGEAPAIPAPAVAPAPFPAQVGPPPTPAPDTVQQRPAVATAPALHAPSLPAQISAPARDERPAVLVVKPQRGGIAIAAGISLAVLIGLAAWIVWYVVGSTPPGDLASGGSADPSGSATAPSARADGGDEVAPAVAASSAPDASLEVTEPATADTAAPSAASSERPASCSRDGDCPGGGVCTQGRCEAPRSKPSSPSCGKDTDCPGDMVCVKGQCQTPKRQSAPKSCGKDTDCPGADVCVAGHCRTPSAGPKTR